MVAPILVAAALLASDAPHRTWTGYNRVYDFEDGTLQGWTILEQCATSDPSYGNMPQPSGSAHIWDNTGFSGTYIRSQNPGFGNDWTKGILESPQFELCQTTTIRYLLGGGSHCSANVDPQSVNCNSNIVSFNLEVLSAPGTWQQKEKDCGGTYNIQQKEDLSERTWVITDEPGATARIRAYDLHAGGWGHNSFDNVRIECTVPCTSCGPPVTSNGDPHLTLAHGARADFRGHHGSIYNFLSTYSMSANVRIANASFYLRPPPTYANITVHGTMITEAYIVARTAKGRWLNVTYSADKVQGDHARRDVVTASCSSQADTRAEFSVQPGQVYPCDNNFLYMGFSTLQLKHSKTGDDWTLKIKSMPVYDSISGAHHRLDMMFEPLTPEAQFTSMPHGIIGQSWDGDGRAMGGALDEYPTTEGAIFTTYAMAEGAIEGVPSDYEVSYPYDVAFKYSRFGQKGVSARNSSKLTSRLVETTVVPTVGASGDPFKGRAHVEL